MTYQDILSEIDVRQRIILECEANLKNTDYVAIKIAEGVASKEEYADVLNNRKLWRDNINLAQSEISSLNSLKVDEVNFDEERLIDND